MNKITNLYVTLFNLGKIKYMPGSFGSIASYIIIFFIYKFFSYLVLILIFIIILITCIYTINIYISKKITKDPKEIVIDEFLGCYIIFISFPLLESFNIYYLIFSSFIIFRAFDIIKPFPINIIDKNMNNSIGIILDDIVAGIYTILVLVLINEYIL